MPVSSSLNPRARTAAKLVRVLTISLVVNPILLILLLAITVAWRAHRGTNVAAAEQQICQSRSDLIKYGQLPEGCPEMKRKYDEDDECCCKASSVISILVQKPIENKFYWYTNRETREKDLVYWNRSGLSITDSVRYVNGRFVINVPGIYLVFSQIKYRDDPESRQNPSAIQTHYLQRYSFFKHGQSEKLAENKRDFSQLHVAENSGTSFIVTVIKGFKADQLMIKSSHTHMLSGDNHENVFGLYYISTFKPLT